jgi:hypothetical protein
VILLNILSVIASAASIAAAIVAFTDRKRAAAAAADAKRHLHRVRQQTALDLAEGTAAEADRVVELLELAVPDAARRALDRVHRLVARLQSDSMSEAKLSAYDWKSVLREVKTAIAALTSQEPPPVTDLGPLAAKIREVREQLDSLAAEVRAECESL